MARREHLPIYKAALDMAVHIERLEAGFSRYHKYTLETGCRGPQRLRPLRVDCVSRRIGAAVIQGAHDTGPRRVAA